MDGKSNTDSAKETVYETVRDAVVGNDAPMEEEHKVAAGALVGGTYPILLVLLLLIALAVTYFSSRSKPEVTEPVKAESQTERFR